MAKWVVAFLCAWLSGCVTYHAAVHVTPGQKVKLAEDEVLIFGRVVGTSDVPSDMFQDSRQPFGIGKLYLAHVPNIGKSMLAQHREHEGWQAFIGDFIVSSLIVDQDGFFGAIVPAGEYILTRSLRSELGFDCRIPGSACYLGTLNVESDRSAPRINGHVHPGVTVSNELPLAQERMAAIVEDFDAWAVSAPPVQPLPCTFHVIGYPPRMDYPPRGKPAVAPGKLAVTVSQYSPNPVLDVLASGKSEAAKAGALGGAAVGALYGALAPLYLGPWGILLYPYIAPITTAAGLVLGTSSGAIFGALAGIDDEQAKSLATAVHKATSGQPIQGVLGAKIASKAAEAGIDATLLREAGPRERSETPGYSEINRAGYGSVIELSVLKAGFDVDRGGDSPLLDFGMRIQVRTLGFGDTGASEVRLILLQTRVRALGDWLLDDGRLLVQDMNESLDSVSQCLSEALFPSVPPSADGVDHSPRD